MRGSFGRRAVSTLGTVKLSGARVLGRWEASRHGRCSASKLPIPLGLPRSTLNLTVLQDRRRQTLTGSSGVVILTARTPRQERQEDRRTLYLWPFALLSLPGPFSHDLSKSL